MATIRPYIENQRQVDRWLRSRGPKARRAFANALNRVGRFARKESISEIAQRWKFKRRYLQQRMDLLRARRDQLDVVIQARKRGTLLSRFPYRQLRRRGKQRALGAGIRVEVRRGQPKKLHSAFLVPLHRGNEAGGNNVGIAVRNVVLQRLGKRTEATGGRGGRAYSVLHTISVHHAFRAVIPVIHRRVSDRFNREIELELGRAMTER